MNHHAGGLADHHQVVVLIDDVERNLLGLRRDGECFRDLDLDDVARSNTSGGLCGLAVEANEMTLDQARGCGSAQVGRVLGDEPVEPRRARRGDQLVGLRKR
jgi:hypothetical protein